MIGGHSPSPSVYKISYLDDLKNLTADHSDWSPSQIRKEAAIRFRPRFRQDKASSIQETRNEAMSPGPEFILKDGEVYYPDYGMSANELNERTLRLNPSEYSLAQHQATAVMSEAFSNGATEVVTTYHREGEDHRDLVVMKYDPVTGKGKMTILNAAQDGNFHKFQDMQSVAKSQFVTHYEMRPANNVFILSDKPLAHQKVQKALGYVEQRIASVLREPDRHVVDVKLEQQKEVKELIHTSESHPPLQSDSTSQKRERRDEVNRAEQIFQSERLSLTKSREKPERVLEVIQKRHRKMTETKTAFHIVAETQVAVAAVPLLIASLAKELPKPIRAVEKSIVRYKKKEARRFKKIEKIQRMERRQSRERWREVVIDKGKKEFRVSKRRKIALRPESRGKRDVERKKRRKLEKRVKWKVLLEQTVSALPIKQTETLHVPQKEKKLEKKQRRLAVLFLRLARKVNARERRITGVVEFTRKPQSQKGLHIEKPRLIDVAPKEIRRVERKMRREKKKEAVARFSFAMIIWLVFTEGILQKKDKTQNIKKTEQLNPLVQNEPTHWVLLAIIWYLVMIREGGMTNKPINKYTNTTNNQMKTTIQPQGVIFAYQPRIRAMMEIYG